MIFRFRPRERIIRVKGMLLGHVAPVWVWLALDTGASTTMISNPLLVAAGYTPATSSKHVQMVTASGGGSAPFVRVQELQVLGQTRTGLDVLAHTLPIGVKIDGLLGLDFPRGFERRIDFRNGILELQ